MKTAVILQSNYIPWRGYFDLISVADHFFFYDVVQYTKNDWRNRNQIKGPNGAFWLTIPTGTNIKQQINQVEVTNTKWKKKHLSSINQAYSKAAHFDDIALILKDVYSSQQSNLSGINQQIIRKVSTFLKFKTQFHNIDKIDLSSAPTLRLINILKEHGISRYITGPSAKNYLDESQFSQNNIELTYFDYSGYRPYPQLHGPFVDHLSIIDLLANQGLNSREHFLGSKGLITPEAFHAQ